MQDIRAFVEEYVAAATGPDREHHVALFHDDATVHDDGRSLRGLAEVRRWREGTPNVDYDLLEVAGTPAACRAVAQVCGDFPGSPVTLRFAFERDARGKITVLTITPDDARPDDGPPTRRSAPWRRE
ncbi:nuclear transport factor 2 family protein [Streptomyces sp. NPDC056568]|uniref:nuclear transport factor 2 family protein n=1 Tax=Streptomyces sp. NPDC056568 TaxID=3345866 RepID=UPI003685CD3F